MSAVRQVTFVYFVCFVVRDSLLPARPTASKKANILHRVALVELGLADHPARGSHRARDALPPRCRQACQREDMLPVNSPPEGDSPLEAGRFSMGMVNNCELMASPISIRCS